MLRESILNKFDETENVLFSIIVPVYNVENYLEECLASIQKQIYKDFECILVNDGSTDGSAIICDKYCNADNRFIAIHKENGGLVSARQEGAKRARGEYVVCVDGDDWIADDFLREFASVIGELQPDILCSGIIWYYSDKQVKMRPLNIEQGGYSRNRIEKEIFPFLIHDDRGKYFLPSLCGKAIKKDIYLKQQLLVDKNIKIGEDLACTYTCVCASSSIYCLKDCWYYYRQNTQSMTHKKVYDSATPRLIGEHLAKCMGTTKMDFAPQIYRIVIHLLFNCCKTQFYSRKKYLQICRNIDKILKDPYYDKALRNCNFSKKYLQGRLALFALKHRAFFLIKLYSMKK